MSDIHSALWPTNTSGDRPLCVGPTPVSKGFAIFSVFRFFNFSVLRQGVDPRVQRTHFFTPSAVWRQIRGAGIGSQISPTLSNLAVTLIERSWSSTYQEVPDRPNQIFIILQSGTSTAVLSLYRIRSTIFRLQCSKCLQTWTFMVVQSNWSWLPTILLLGLLCGCF